MLARCSTSSVGAFGASYFREHKTTPASEDDNTSPHLHAHIMTKIGFLFARLLLLFPDETLCCENHRGYYAIYKN